MALPAGWKDDMNNLEQDAPSLTNETDDNTMVEIDGKLQPKPKDMVVHVNVKEEIIWQHDITKGIFKKEVVESWILTNVRAIRGGSYVMLKDCDSIVIANRHSRSQGSGVSVRAGYARVGNYNSQSKTIGDVQFIKGGVPVIMFHQVVDPGGLSAMAKAARKNILTLIKEAEKELKATEESKKSQKGAGITCPECKNKNPPGAKFCNGCGKSLSSSCPKCQAPNPLGSSFCGQCGLPLS